MGEQLKSMEVTMQHEQLITIPKLSEQLGGISRASIYRHVKAIPGFPQPVKIGAATRFRQSEVEAYILSISASLSGGAK
jgi:predicted DNA-binding transcriptional regulator AlpA